MPKNSLSWRYNVKFKDQKNIIYLNISENLLYTFFKKRNYWIDPQTSEW